MAKNENQMSMPGVFGGLMRYDEEYTSRFMMNPTTVIVMIVIVVLLVLALKLFLPIDPTLINTGDGAGAPIHGAILSLMGKL